MVKWYPYKSSYFLLKMKWVKFKWTLYVIVKKSLVKESYGKIRFHHLDFPFRFLNPRIRFLGVIQESKFYSTIIWSVFYLHILLPSEHKGIPTTIFMSSFFFIIIILINKELINDTCITNYIA